MNQEYEQPIYTRTITWDWTSFAVGAIVSFFIFNALGREILGTAGRYGEKRVREKLEMFK